MKRTAFLFAVWASWFADLGEEQTQEIGDLGCRADRRTSRAHLILLFNGNCRADIDQPIDIRASHLVEKHPGVSREGFHIPPLAFGKDRVERERRFS